MYRQAIASLASHLALGRSLAFIDLETTGVSIGRDRIVQVGIVRIERNGDYYEYDRLVNPEMPIPPDAVAVHGITNAMVANAATFKALVPELSRVLRDCDFAGYNAKRFDRKLLEAEYARVGVRWPFEDAKLVDVFRIFVQQEARTLAGAMKFYCGVPDFQGHQAIDDVRATIRVLAGQLARYPDLPTTVEGLHEFGEQRDRSWVDADGKIVFRNGEACINFGKNAGRRLRDMAKTDPGYLRWMATSDFSAEVKTIVGDALRGRFPVDLGRSVTPREIADTEVPATRSKLATQGPPMQYGAGQDASWPEPADPTWPEPTESSWPEPMDPSWPEPEDAEWPDIEDLSSTEPTE